LLWMHLALEYHYMQLPTAPRPLSQNTPARQKHPVTKKVDLYLGIRKRQPA